MKARLIVTTPASLRAVGGRSLVARLLLQLEAAGAAAVEVVAPPGLRDRVRANLEEAAPGGSWTMLQAEPTRPESLLAVIHADRVLDPRIIEHMLSRDRPCRLLDPERGGVDVGISVVDAAGQVGASCRLADIPRYSRELRRPLDPYWVEVRDDRDARRARALLASASGKGCQEWLVLVLNRPIETWLSRLLSETAVTPNQITVAGAIVALLATWQFAIGNLGAGVIVALAAQIVDGLDGRQARIQLRFSPAGRLEHALDKLIEASWVAALAWHLSGHGTRPGFLVGGLVWIVAASLANAAGSTFRARRGLLPEQTGRIDALIRLVAARRNTNTAYLGIGLLLGWEAETFWFLVWLSAGTASLLWARVGWLLGTGAGRQPA